ncbi:Uncharacterised protein [Orientia tsutsugamushi]|nr:hypothetical protein OTSTA763_1236 [Orientia tsutsugamushi str. TA763]SPP26281.1 Uncharacterised protein [Orientia tsutsugamushi]
MYNYNYDILNIVLINSHLFIARMSVNANLESETVSMIKEKMLVKKKITVKFYSLIPEICNLRPVF